MRDLLSEMDAHLARSAVVEAAPESRVDDLLPELFCRVEVVHGIEVSGRSGGVEAVDVEVDPVGAQELGEDLCHRGRVRAVGCGVLGMVGRRHEWPPARVFDSRRVAVIEPRYRPVAVCRHRRGLAGHTPAPAIAVTGRQKRNRYLALRTDMRASALTVLTIASSRAVSRVSSARAVARSRAAMLNCRMTFAV